MNQQIFEKVRAPQPREIWQVKNEKLVMNGKRKMPILYRPVIVLGHKELYYAGCKMVNIVPLTKVGKPDDYRFPVYSGFESINEAIFAPDKNSLALLKLYQPIQYCEFGQKCGCIDNNTYEALQLTLCTNIVGAYQFNLNFDSE